MMRSMSRVALAGCMALAALGATAILDVGSRTAEAAPNTSPFAGTYAYNAWTFAISDRGRITGSYSLDYGGREFAKGSLSGSVSDDGSYSFTVSENGAYYWNGGERGEPLRRWKSNYALAGTMATDAAGNIVGTVDGGGSLFWLRQ